MPSPSERSHFLARIRQVRREAYGDDGIPHLARELGIPPGTWENYEAGVTIPDTILLQFVYLTGSAPHWLLAGAGPPYSTLSDPNVGRG